MFDRTYKVEINIGPWVPVSSVAKEEYAETASSIAIVVHDDTLSIG